MRSRRLAGSMVDLGEGDMMVEGKNEIKDKKPKHEETILCPQVGQHVSEARSK